MRGISPTTPLRPLLARAALAAALLLAAPAAARAALADGGEYYVVSDYYSKVLGLNADGATPRLSAPGTNADAATYVVVAEASGEAGWWRLRNKGTGKYLRASTSDTWSVGWSDAGGTGSEFLWRLDVQFGRSIVCKKNQDKRLGCDWTEEAYVPVYYDKPASSRTRFSVVPALPGGFGASMAAARTEVFANDIGTQEQDVYSVADALTLDRPIDLHLISGDAPIAEGGSVDIADRDAWVVFENVRPSEVIEKYLQRITVGGVAARNGTNVRVAIYLDGAAVIPWLRRDAVLTGFDGAQCTGEKKELVVQNATTLGAWNNRIRSFILKRGFMATLASGTGGGGYTRVYVADHADLVVPSLPEALDLRISSVHIKPWQYASKKGWCSTQGNSGIAAGAAKMKASWFYTWSADRQTTADCEYAPIRQHVYWPSLSTIGGLSGSTHVLGFNEPDHSEQHDKCDCGGTISSWTATTKTPEMAAVGMRVGSPAPTDASWLTEYIGHVDDMAYRCDFVAFHAYWGPNEANGASAWYDRLKAIYDKTKRPIWITEWAYGASWTTETWPSKYGDQLEKNRAAVMEIVDMLERAPFVERYAYYQWDTSSRRFINDDGWVTPAGRVYRDTKSTFAYNASMQKAPNWWRPGTKTPTLAYTVDTDKQEVVFALGNTNGDLAATLVVERRAADGTWTAFHEAADRSQFDDNTLELRVPAADIDRTADTFRLRTTTLSGGEATSAELSMGIRNPDCNDGTSGWTVASLGTKTGEAYDGNTANAYWDQWKGAGLSSSMSQTVAALPAGDYHVAALLRASSNTTVTLTAEALDADGQGTGRASTQRVQGAGSTTIAGSPYQHGWAEVALPPVFVAEGQSLRITASATGEGSAWWSADHFTLAHSTPTAIARPEAGPASAGGDTYTLDGRRAGALEPRRVYIQGKQKVFIHQ